MKKQIVVIHGGDTFDSYEDYLKFLNEFEIGDDFFTDKGWKSSLQKELGDEYEVLLPRMPNSLNAKYIEWKIWFDKMLPFLNKEIILVGYSLGGIFLTKYLSENILNKKLKAVFVVAGPCDTEGSDESLADFILRSNFSKVTEQTNNARNLYFYQSKDDPIVPFQQLAKYQKVFPNATFSIFDDRGHFNQPDFPELIKDIKKVCE